MSENQFFLSYSRKQLYFAEALSLALQKTGLAVWMDLQQLEPGSDWQNQIDEGLRNCSALVLVASKQSLSSPYVESEWRAAMESGKPIYLACYEEVILPSPLESASLVDFRGSFRKAVGVLAAALKNLSNVRERVQPPNRFGLPQKMPPMIMLFAGLLILETLFPLLHFLFSSRWPILFKIILAAVGCPSALLMTGPFLRHRLVILLSRLALWSLWPLIYLFSAPTKRLEAIPGIGWWTVTCLPIVFLGIATYLLPYSRLGADLLRWSAPGGDMGVDTLRRRFNTAKFAKDNQAQVIHHQILTARNSEQKRHTNVKPARDMPALPPTSSGEEIRTYSLHFAAADNPVATTLRKTLNRAGLQEVNSNAQNNILILSENLPRSNLRELLDSGGRVILLLISNITFQGDTLLERAASLQLIDYRDRSRPTLTALARTLKELPEGDLPIGFETNPRPLNSAVLPLYAREMSALVLSIGGWLVLSGLISLTQSLGGAAPLSLFDLAGFVCGFICIQLSKSFLLRETTNFHFVPVLLISTWLAIPLYLGSFVAFAEVLSTNTVFDWRITLSSLFTNEAYWSCLICPGGFVVVAMAIMWHRRLGDWLPSTIARSEQGDRFKPLRFAPAKNWSWLAWILLALILGGVSSFGLRTATYMFFLLFKHVRRLESLLLTCSHCLT